MVDNGVHEPTVPKRNMRLLPFVQGLTSSVLCGSALPRGFFIGETMKTKKERNEYARIWAKNHPESGHRYKLKNRYGISIVEYNTLLKSQNGVCAICEQLETKKMKNTLQYLSVDHCHKTGKNRGLLCDSCNRTLGNMKDDIVLFRKAMGYLIKWGVMDIDG